MNPISNARTLRRTAWCVLLVWLFALSSAVANACLLAEPGAHTAAGVLRVAVHDGITPADHAVEHDGSQASCLKVCDDGTKSVVKTSASAQLPGLTPAIPSTFDELAAASVAPASPGDAQAPIHRPEVPIRVRYSRLAL